MGCLVLHGGLGGSPDAKSLPGDVGDQQGNDSRGEGPERQQPCLEIAGPGVEQCGADHGGEHRAVDAGAGDRRGDAFEVARSPGVLGVEAGDAEEIDRPEVLGEEALGADAAR